MKLGPVVQEEISLKKKITDDAGRRTKTDDNTSHWAFGSSELKRKEETDPTNWKHIQQKNTLSGSAKTYFGQKSGPAMDEPAYPDDGLGTLEYKQMDR